MSDVDRAELVAMRLDGFADLATYWELFAASVDYPRSDCLYICANDLREVIHAVRTNPNSAREDNTDGTTRD